jgi:hypothetical protein
MCANIEVSGTGNVVPEGVTFPGAYKTGDPGINFNVYQGNTKYIVPGPVEHIPSGTPLSLTPQPIKVMSPMGNSEADKKYYATVKSNDAKFGVVTNLVNSMFPTVYGVDGKAGVGAPKGGSGLGSATALGALEGLIKGSGGKPGDSAAPLGQLEGLIKGEGAAKGPKMKRFAA